jgi:hypothetical protein
MTSILDGIAASPWARTLWQGFIVDALVAIGAGLMILLATGDLTSPVFWTSLGLLVGKSLLTALASWLTRLKPVLPADPTVG